MNIAIASDDQIHVSGHIGRCKSFIVFKTDKEKILNKEIRKNVFTNHHRGQQHHHIEGRGGGGDGHSHLIDGLKDCNVLIFSSGGWRLIDDLKANNITPFLTDEDIAEEAALKYLQGNLVEKEDNDCTHG
jgi:predicted Fe-Mo cluster-binding NifX family protein